MVGKRKAFSTLKLLQPFAGTSVADSETRLGVQRHIVFLQSSHACALLSSYNPSYVWTCKCQGSGQRLIDFVECQWPDQRGEESTLFSHPTLHLHWSVTIIQALCLVSVVVPIRLMIHPNPGSPLVRW